MLSKKEQLKQAALDDFVTFVRLILPLRVLGDCHVELMNWMTRPEAKSHRLVLLPRDHQKSAIAGLYVVWKITKNPAIRVLYISSTSNLATKQLKFIKDILTSDIYRLFWPEMVNQDEAKREKWSETEISVDHPLRRIENVRDPTVFTAGLTTTITGLHCDLAVMDDVVVPENAYTNEGREKTELQYSHLASIEGADSEELVVGTIYGPMDLYHTLMSRTFQEFDEQGNITLEEPLYEVFRRQVEDKGDGTGNFLWPRQKRPDGKWFGFNPKILATKKLQYLDQTQFYCQYYNDPNTGDNKGIPKDCFQYYSKDFLRREGGLWYYNGNRLNVFAAIDFAYTKKARSDYSAIVVVGIDKFNNIYVLDIDRFKTNQISEYYSHLLKMHNKWGFNIVKAETTAAQEVIVEDLKINYIRPNGLALTVEPYKPHKYEGSKEERMEAILNPRYLNGNIWHQLGGHFTALEEELVLKKPPHDDIKDTLTTAITACIAPTDNSMHNYSRYPFEEHTHRRFGGIA